MSVQWIKMYENILQTLQYETDVGSSGVTTEKLSSQNSQVVCPG